MDLVSVLIRTCQRPNVLRRALESVQNQTYKNIEVVVVEDGIESARTLIETEFKDLNIVYYPTIEKKGRSYAGNKAMEIAHGKYLNFLDDDDILYPEHVELLVKVLDGCKNKAAYAIAEEAMVTASGIIKKVFVRYQQPYNRILLTTMNYFPIQTVLFERALFEEKGGFDEEIDMMEDWDLWLRFSTETDFEYLEKITSKYYTPAEKRKKQNRSSELRETREYIIGKMEKYTFESNIASVNKEAMYLLREYNQNPIVKYLRILARLIIWGEK